MAVLSLFEVEVNISLLTNGGQSVTQYTVSGSLVFLAGVCWTEVCESVQWLEERAVKD